MEADEIVKALKDADYYKGPDELCYNATLALAEALCCVICEGRGGAYHGGCAANDWKWEFVPCSKCGDIRSAVRRWKEGRNA